MIPQRTLKTTHATMLVVGNVVGAGVFFLPGSVLSATGSPKTALLAWFLGGLTALSGALVLGECASRIPQNGGDYQYLRRSLGRSVGFLSGWTAFLIGFPGSLAFLSNMLATTIHPEGGALQKGIAAFSLVVITIICLFPVSIGARINAWIVGLTISILFMTTQLGAPMPNAWQGSIHGANLGGGLVAVFFAYSGWNIVTYVSGECEHPGSVVPRAMLGGLAIVTLLYLAFNATLIATSSPEFLTETPGNGLQVTQSLFGSWGGNLISWIIVFAIMTTLLSTGLAGPRITQKMAEQGDFFSWFATNTAQSGVPLRATMTQGLIALILLLSGSFEDLLSWTVLSMVLFGTLTTIAQVRLRLQQVRDPNHRVFEDPLFPISTIIYGSSCTWVFVSIIQHQPLSHTVASGVLIGAGLILFKISKERPKS